MGRFLLFVPGLLVSCVPAGAPGPIEAGSFRAELDAEGLVVEGDAQPLRLRFSGWGREGAVTALGPVAPFADGERAVFIHAGVEEWWAPLDRGAEQGWVATARPPGEGELVFDVAVSGAEVAPSLGSDRLSITGAERRWTYSAVHAWDATGAELPAELAASRDTIRVIVDDAGATYPITVDPVLSMATWTVQPNVADTYFGYYVGGLGDVNADGYDDFAVGAPRLDNGNTNEGAVYVYNGTATGPSTTASWSKESNGTGYYLGWSVEGAGDVNGDGFADLIAGQIGYTNGQSGEGRASVYHGSASGLSSVASWNAEGNLASAAFGSSVAGAGDVNGDGYDDVIVGAYTYTGSYTSEGKALVYYGSSGGIASSSSWDRTGSQNNAQFGGRVSSAGDFNGDGYDDVVVAAPAYNSGYASEGRITMYFGSASGLDSFGTWNNYGGAAGTALGTVLVHGDFNGDGYSDVAAGAPGYRSTPAYGGAPTTEGQVRAWWGRATPQTTSDWSVQSGETNAAMGSALAVADVNGDGYDDLAVGVPSDDYTYTNEGTVWLYMGSATGLNTSAELVVGSGEAGGVLGSGGAGVGDVDGDGLEDVVFGAYAYASGETGEGRAWLFSGAGEDADGDGYYTGGGASADCDDTDATVNPGAAEVCDDLDQDCDGVVDNGVLSTWYRDVDRDGYGLSSTTTIACSRPTGYAALGGDCNDASSSVNPGATDIVGDGVDTDCSGGDNCYADADHDGYGTTATVPSSDADCSDSGEASTSTDCDDTDATVSPGATEVVGDGEDGNCDSAESCYTDADADGYGSTTVLFSTDLDCTDSGEATVSTDCDDADRLISPATVEIVGDGADQDCSGGDTCRVDADHDGAGGATTTVSADLDCTDSGEAATTTDCNDAAATVYPGAPETWADGVDQDCDSGDTCYTDTDGDAYGSAAAVGSADLDCSDAGEARVGGDCDDGAATVYPSASETVADGVDQDCDSGDTCFVDADRDDFGTATPIESLDLDCSDAGEATVTTDCDDGVATVYPGAVEETADGVDQDCDGFDVCFVDDDGDAFGSTRLVLGTSLSCAGPGESTTDADCDDADGLVFPGATEQVGDDVDQDCDGGELCWADDDGDGQGSATVKASADPSCGESGEARVSTDCDDTRAAVYLGATEVPASGIDEDCDGEELCPSDVDGDGYGSTGDTTATTDLACESTGLATTADDCNDADATVSPGGTELTADGVDSDCDAIEACWRDVDQDTHGVPELANSTDLTCATRGFSAVDDDCDDTDPAAFPGADEVFADGTDQDCDGGDSCYADEDADGFGGTTPIRSPDLACDADGEGATADDCDDAAPTVFPDAPETCNAVDDDCDGTADDGVSDCDTDRDRSLCGCATTDAAGALAPLLALAALVRRRRIR